MHAMSKMFSGVHVKKMWLVALPFLFGACLKIGDEDVDQRDAGANESVDAGRLDAGLPVSDAGKNDSGAGIVPPVTIDGGPSPSDAGIADVVLVDANLGDAGPADASATDSGFSPNPPLDAGGVVSPPPPLGQIDIDACIGETGVDEKCVLVTNASACVNEKCSKLVVVFSGGDMGCIDREGYQTVLAGYASHGYAAVCINYFETETGSAQKPYVDEASRIDLALRHATAGAWAQAYWTGENLLLEGISHGATAPVTLMARTALELQSHWQGTNLSAGCFFDGIYDPIATSELLLTGGLGCGLLYNRLLKRYCGPAATASNCDLASEEKVQEDTITNVLPLRFGLEHFKMFECGSALSPCFADLTPAEPIEVLCTRLDASPSRSCDYVSLPTDSHLTCHATHYDSCRTWFEDLLSQ